MSNSIKMIPTKERIRGLIQIWKNSALFHKIDDAVSNHYRRKLKNDQFTILCSNCVGGMIYHRYGKKFLSPTINMFIANPDFVEFCVHLDYYLTQELHFIETEEATPVAQLIGDGKEIPTITLHFNHDKVAQTVRRSGTRESIELSRITCLS